MPQALSVGTLQSSHTGGQGPQPAVQSNQYKAKRYHGCENSELIYRNANNTPLVLSSEGKERQIPQQLTTLERNGHIGQWIMPFTSVHYPA